MEATRKLRDIEVSTIGFGCMGFSCMYGEKTPDEEAVKTIREAYNIGYTFFDTAEVYGKGQNEILVGKALKDVRDKVQIATKFTIYSNDNIEGQMRTRIKNALERLQTTYVDILYLHRTVDNINLEEIARVMGLFIKEGIIKGWGLSQVDAATIKRAHAITPLTAIQSEFSIVERGNENEVIPLCKELNIGFVPFSPLASGYLSGKVKKEDTYEKTDVRSILVRFEKENIEKNQPFIDLLNKFAKEKNATPAQIALAWMIKKHNNVVPIPASRKIERIIENFNALKVQLTDSDVNRIEDELKNMTFYGDRSSESDKIKMLIIGKNIKGTRA
ncbi:putative aldo/keto reductase [Neocallimastix lanati (nom. inval.)]|jgi:aryl-alcohol dehydrogenase-like predicted oxidoreductase|uniref:Putative aldo/keto reductase n=1 Tax=Neocallimastix californiae TaxID=1754190 RepID=A0A1Y2C279_9FUNG|nr:putative aldo/keto reductase [Neocallimastix sp. JGI-2020a]ORY41148.1 putative aldo/keto reductase [Neocallimastix californiae]|eukprot:ORY41148.1 putative aldo/keto reductase [Neocallimastix californiae]